MQSLKSRIIKDIGKYASSQYISQALGFFIATLMRRFLGPFYMGIWGVLKAIIGYSTYTHMGTAHALYYKIPIHKGRGEDAQAQEVQDIVFSFLTLTNSFVCAGILIAAFIFKHRIPKELFVGFLVLPLIFIAQRYYNYYVMLLRAHKNFNILSKSYIFDAVVDLALIILLVGRFKLYGLYAVSILLPILNIGYIQLQARYRVTYRIVKQKLLGYIRFGLPLVIQGVLEELLRNIDTLMIAAMIGFEQAGFYSIAMMSRSYSIGVSTHFSAVISPYFMEDYGRMQDGPRIKKYVMDYAEAMAWLMSALLGAICIAFPVFIMYLMPRFLPGIGAMKAMLFCTFFMAVSQQARNFLVAKEKQIILMFVSLGTVVLDIILNYTAIRAGLGITGVAAATSLSMFVGTMLFLILAARHFENGKGVVLFLVRVLLPLILATLIVLAIDRGIVFSNILIQCLLQLSAYGMFCLFAVFYVNKKTGVLSALLSRKK